LTREGLISLVRSLVLSRLDYCNVLYDGLCGSVISKLQRVQNASCRLIFHLRRCSHLTEYFVDLHWLRVRERITFKSACWMFKVINSLPVPAYVSALIDLSWGIGRNASTLRVPRVATNYGARSFHVFGPRIWNGLPDEVKMARSFSGFKCKLKTHLFVNSHFST
jgi:hypothetical protein